MRRLLRLILPVLLCGSASLLQAQSAADAATLADLKTASKQMQLESDGAVPFRMEATFATSDFLGRPDNQGRWTEEFARPGYARRVIKDGNSPENYAPEDQAAIGAPAPAKSGSFMQRLLVSALLTPGPTDRMIEQSKVTYKTQKVGAVSLRCVTLEPLQKSKTPFLQQAMTRVYCVAGDRPVIRLAQLSYGINVSYNSLAHFGDRTFAQQITASQRGRERGKLQVVKLVAAPELQQADLPKTEMAEPIDADHSGAVKVGADLIAGQILNKVAPVYPMDSKQKHISGVVLLQAIISKEGTIDTMEVTSAPADDLAEAAMDAVSQWRYKPYLLNGRPTEVETTVTVIFSMGR